MDDLAKRLRKKVEVQGHQDGVPCWMSQEIPLQVEAADKIDSLTAELAEVRRTINDAAFERAEAISTDDLVKRLAAELAEARKLLREWFKNMDPPARIDDRVRAAINEANS